MQELKLQYNAISPTILEVVGIFLQIIMFLFLGEYDKGFFVEEIAKKHNKECKFTGYISNLNKTLDEVLTCPDCEMVIVDVANLCADCSVIEKFLKDLSLAMKSKIVVMASGYSTSTDVIQAAVRAGIKYYLLAIMMGNLKEELENVIKGVENVESVKIETPKVEKMIEKNQAEMPKPVNPFNKPYKTIGYAGIIQRMGTTTLALQTVKFLKLQGKTACYIEMNNTHFVEKLLERADDNEIEHDRRLGKVTFENIDMFYKKDRISEILHSGYDFYIYDFGCITQDNLISYFEKTYKILLCGSSPNEMDGLQKVLKYVYDKDISYLFNFVSNSEREMIKELMDEKADHTFFSGYAPDMFSYSSDNNFFQEILHKEFPKEKEKSSTENSLPQKKKKGLFGRKRR